MDDMRLRNRDGGTTAADKGNIVCATLNSCTLKVSATDVNLQDTLDWKVDVSDDDVHRRSGFG